MNDRTARRVAWFVPLVAAAVVFGPVILRGESLFLRYAWDANNILAFYPWNIFSAREFAAGHFPLWNPHNACGVPHLANWQSAPLYPLHLILFLHPSEAAFDVFYLARLGVLAAGVWLATGALVMRTPSRICALTAAAFSGYFMAYSSMVHLNVEALFPWAIWLVARQSKRWKTNNWLGLVIVFTTAFLGGNPESTLYLAALTVAWALWLDIFEGRRLFIATMVASASAVILASPQWLPFIEYLPHAWHIHPVGAGVQWLKPGGMYSIFFAVSGTTGGYFVPYLGAAVLLLSLLGSTLDRRAMFFFVATAGVLGLVYGLPGFKWITHLPAFSRMASFKYALAPLSIMVAILAGRGMEGLLEGKVRRSSAVCIAAALGVFVTAFTLYNWWGGADYNYSGALIAVVCLGAAGAAIYLWGGRSATALLFIVAFELVLNTRALGLRPLLDSARFAEREEVRYLNTQKEGRVASPQDVFPSDLNLVGGFDDVNLLDALYPAGYVRKVGEALGFGEEKSIKYFKNHGYSFPITPQSVDSLVWPELGVRYYFGDELERAWMKRVVGRLWEDPAAPGILYVDGRPASWAAGSWAQDMKIRGDMPVTLLRARMTRLPGWRAWADGRETMVSEWNDLFIEIKLSKPAGEIRLRYMPYSWKAGLWAGISSLLFLTVALLLSNLQYHGRVSKNPVLSS